MNNTLQFTIETLIDAHGLAEVLAAIAETCHEKSSHVRENWNDAALARAWTRNAKVAERAQNKVVSTY